MAASKPLSTSDSGQSKASVEKRDPASAVAPSATTEGPSLGPHPDQVEQNCACQICHQPKHRSEVFPSDLVRPGVLAAIRKDHPDFGPDGCICLDDLNRYRAIYAKQMLETPSLLTPLQREIVDGLDKEQPSEHAVDDEFDRMLTFGERLADRIAEMGGSWTFLICFAVIMIGWMTVNSLGLIAKPFDPYPFILLNLALSCLAAVQAPVIMMSQNRQEERDRIHSEHDYRVNLKAELEIRHLHAKLDMLMTEQWQRLLEVQQTQLELITAAKAKLDDAERLSTNGADGAAARDAAREAKQVLEQAGDIKAAN